MEILNKVNSQKDPVEGINIEKSDKSWIGVQSHRTPGSPFETNTNFFRKTAGCKTCDLYQTVCKPINNRTKFFPNGFEGNANCWNSVGAREVGKLVY